MRPYALQELAFLVFMYCIVRIFIIFRLDSKEIIESSFLDSLRFKTIIDYISFILKSKVFKIFLLFWSLAIMLFLSFIFYIDKVKSDDFHIASLRVDGILLSDEIAINEYKMLKDFMESKDASLSLNMTTKIDSIESSELKKLENMQQNLKIKTKILYPSLIFRAQSPLVNLKYFEIKILDSITNIDLDFINSKNYTFEKNRQKYIIFESLKPFNIIDSITLQENLQGKIIGNIKYNIKIESLLYIAVFGLYFAVILLFIVFFSFLVILFRIYKNAKLYDKALFLLAISSSFLMLTGYFALIFVLLIFSILTFYMFIKSYNFRIKIFYFIAFFISLVFNKILYKSYFNAFFDYRGSEATSKISIEYFRENIINIISILYRILVDNLGFVIIFMFLSIIILLIFYRKYYKFYSVAFIISSTSLLWCFLVMIVAPYKTLRYIMAIFPLLLLALPFIFRIYYAKSRILGHFSTLFCVINIAILGAQKERIENLNFDYKDSLQSFENALNHAQNTHITFIIPLYIQTIIPYLQGQNYKILSLNNLSCDRLDSILQSALNARNANFIIDKNLTCKPKDSINLKNIITQHKKSYHIVESKNFYFLESNSKI
ncbi:hypothetical protein DCO58_00535 [Helicobacter saguini]|uniref:Uncharacterized protein n=1 Tax=Helicobacter saguini TaxID=1548018 RepID=A0A347VZK1_9HELI|nr:hypothetical protein [Helicobacter saguini]MWV63123.1 hypothetical protein [Helicobacter saguini]MWV66207.1 hypothetical protein [Helicobacter saguini]MWV68557.1 hypothetical protein [Helicobacter saguini]MWV71889.1 hypothetical protein [Helicobacter saguini]TLD95904.1 hypothetical protein LS64_000620 [Helicobacter saguini]